ncbi:TonB system transport protein ExbD [Pokkaliibacter sp. CJK22405]|uniref:TonB system transport protein ExbD n=1 Tax=Pokkaliibacter sp. CJK22405 TaxID=3384615 RepID=UPI003985036C
MAGGLHHGDDDLTENHEINVTPFIDVILVLLIIFMVAAPLATVSVPVDLPSSSAKPVPQPEKPIYLTLKDDLSVVLGEAPVAKGSLKAMLDQATGSDHDKRLFLRADKGVPYGELMTLMNQLRAAGYLKIGLVGLEQASH